MKKIRRFRLIIMLAGALFFTVSLNSCDTVLEVMEAMSTAEETDNNSNDERKSTDDTEDDGKGKRKTNDTSNTKGKSKAGDD